MFNKNSISGFTLIEIAIVLIIVSVLLGYTVAMFPIQQELKQYRSADAEMDEIIDALIAFAQVSGRLPCPDTIGDIHNGDANSTGAGVIDGNEDTENLIDNSTGAVPPDDLVDNCKAFFGFLPARTLGIDGDFNANGLLQDPWGGAYGYAISNVDTGAAFGADLISPDGIREEGLGNVTPDLFICDDSAALGTDIDCGAANGGEVVSNVAAVVISLGKSFDLGAGSSNIQRENFDDFHDGQNDKVYIKSTHSTVANAEYDDIVKWLSLNKLISKMIEADQLP